MKRRGRLFTFESQITVLLIGSIFAVTVCTAVFIALLSGNILKQQAIMNCSERLNAVSNRFDVILSQIQSQTSLLTFYNASQEESALRDATPFETFQQDLAFSGYLSEYLATQPSIDAIVYYDQEDSALFKNTYSTVQQEQFLVPQTIRGDFLMSGLSSRWYVQKAPSSQGGNYLFFCLKKSYSFTGRPLGMFTIMVSPGEIQKIYQGSIDSGEIFLITDSSNTVCASSEAALVGQSLEQLFSLPSSPRSGSGVSMGGIAYMYTDRPYKEADMNLILLTPRQAVYRQSYVLFQTVLLLGVAFLALAILLSRRLTRHLLLPLGEIISSVRRMSNGRYDVRVPVHGEDELACLANELNSMADNTQLLLHRIREESEQKHRFELSYLQVQMQPHFLYNTLETACGMIEAGENQDSIELIHQISSFYRATLSKGQDLIPLSHELTITQSYLRIMQTRYAGAFQFTFSVDQAAQYCLLPKLTLQPFVENAVIHGFIGYATEEEKLLRIQVHKQPVGFLVRIEDNGAGMAPERLKQLNSMFPGSGTSPRSFGISSVQKRLQLYFGSTARILIQSALGAGTTVEIYIPEQPV